MISDMKFNAIKYFVEGNLKLPEIFPIGYFETLYKTGKYTKPEIVLGIIALLKTVCRNDLWYVYMKDISIFKNRNSFNHAHDQLNSKSNHILRDSIEYVGVNSRRRFVFQISDKGMKNIEKIFPDLYNHIMNNRVFPELFEDFNLPSHFTTSPES